MAPAGKKASDEGTLDIRDVDLIDVLARRNPAASRAQVAFAAQVMALVGTTVLPKHAASSAELFAERVLALAGVGNRSTPASSDRLALEPRGPAETRQGAGLGERISLAEGRARLASYATPRTIDEWAGPSVGPNELTRRLGIGRSTLQDWRRSGAVVGLLRGTRKHVFPLAQFIDGRPVQGIAEVVSVIGDPRTAWLWLVEPGERGRSHLDGLRSGRTDTVLEAAREDFV